MNVVGRVGSYLSQGVYSVATPFHPFGGAVDIIVVQQQDGSFRSTPWYVRFGKFQGVLKGAEKIVKIEVNGVVSDFHMFLDNSGEAYFIKEITPDKDNDIEDSDKEDEGCASDSVDIQFQDSDSEKRFYEYQDDEQSYDSLEGVDSYVESENVDSEVVLVSVDGQILTAPISNSEAMEEHSENVQLSTPQFRLGLVEGPEFEGDSEFNSESTWANYLSDFNKSNIDKISFQNVEEKSEISMKNVVEDAQIDVKKDVFKSCLSLTKLGVQEESGEELQEKSPQSVDFLAGQTEDEGVGEMRSCESLSPSKSESSKSVSSIIVEAETESAVASPQDKKCNLSDENINGDQEPEELESGDGCTTSTTMEPQLFSNQDEKFDGKTRIEISLCGNLLRPGMGSTAAAEAFNAHRISKNEFQESALSIIKNDTLIVKIGDKYFTWEKAAHIVLGIAAFGLEMPVEPEGPIPVSPTEPVGPSGPSEEAQLTPSPSGRRWRLWPLPFRRVKTLEHSNSNISSEDVFLDSESAFATTPTSSQSPPKQFVRTNVPTNEQISSLNLKDGQNMVSFIFSTRVLGVQKVDAHIYLWKWNARIVISDVDGTITKSDVLGQFMPLVGKDWTQSGVARLFSAIKENGYQLLFLSARAIVQAYLTRTFLLNLKQDGKALPNGPVVISPDGLFPSLFREVIRRAPHEFKIACLEEIRALFPADYNPFYAGFGNRDTDELSYRKIGIPKGKIFIINPKGEVAISHRSDLKGKSYTSLHTLVNDMFPPTSMVEQEDYNSWNYWRMPLPDVNL